MQISVKNEVTPGGDRHLSPGSYRPRAEQGTHRIGKTNGKSYTCKPGSSDTLPHRSQPNAPFPELCRLPPWTGLEGWLRAPGYWPWKKRPVRRGSSLPK